MSTASLGLRVSVKHRVPVAGTLDYGETWDEEILDREQAERKKLSLDTAFEHAAEAIVVTDVEGYIHYCNPAFVRTSGYELAEARGKTPAILKSGKHDEAFYRNLWTTLRTGEIWSGELVNRAKSGTLYEVDATISPIRDSSGTIIGFVSLQRDLSIQRNLEAQLRQAQKMEALGRLASGVAHDFNNLLTVISGYSSLLLSKLTKADRLYGPLYEIRKAGERGAELTQQLLAFSRGHVLQPQLTEMNEIVRELDRMIARLVGEEVMVVARLDPDAGRAMVDAGQMQQVIVNLAVNARDAMPHGGTLTIETSRIRLKDGHAARHPGLEPGEYVVLTVSDTGIGMDEETKGRMFEPFFTTKAPGKGTGLGLSTVFGIVKRSRGYISVESEPGMGAAFNLYFPCEGDVPMTEPGGNLDKDRITGTETILIVGEDEPEIVLMIRNTLRRHGYRVLEASDIGGAEAVCRQFAGSIHLMLTDLSIAGAAGRTLAKRVRQLRPGIKIAFMSGYGENTLSPDDMLDDGCDYIEMPIAPKALATRLRRILDGTATRKTILVVDSDPAVRQFLREVLAGAGYRVSEAGDGKQAIQSVRESSPGLILIDLDMIEFEDVETIRELREAGPNVRIAVMSGAYPSQYLPDVERLDAVGVITKPVVTAELLDVVRTILRSDEENRV